MNRRQARLVDVNCERQDDPGEDSELERKDQGCGKGCDHDPGLGPGCPDHPPNAVPIDHPVGNDHDQPGERGLGQIRSLRPEGEHTGEHEEPAEDARHLAPRTRLVVHRRSGERPGARVAAEEPGSDIRDSLTYELLVDVQPLTTLA